MSSLVVGDILVVIFSRTDPDTFHWCICVSISPFEAVKYHAMGSNTHWWFENPPKLNNLLESNTVSVGVKIGSLDPKTVHRGVLLDILKDIPMKIPEVDKERESKFTCRVWFREAIRSLNAAGVIKCTNVDALEREVYQYGLPNQAAYPTWEGYLSYVSKYSA